MNTMTAIDAYTAMLTHVFHVVFPSDGWGM